MIINLFDLAHAKVGNKENGAYTIETLNEAIRLRKKLDIIERNKKTWQTRNKFAYDKRSMI